MKIALISIVVACALFIVWNGVMLYVAFEIRQQFARVLQSSNDKHDHHVAEVMRGKQLHDIHVATALGAFALFAGISIVVGIRVCAGRLATSQWTWAGLCFAVAVSATSLLSVGRIHWDTSIFELLLIGQILAAVVVAAFCLARLALRGDTEIPPGPD